MTRPAISLPSPNDLLQNHLPWLVGLLPFVMAAIQVLGSSEGDPEVFAYLLQNLGVVPLVLSVIIPLIPLAVILFVWSLLSEYLATPRDQRPPVSRPVVIGCLAFCIVAVSFITLLYLMVVVSTIGLTVSSWCARARKKRRDTLLYGHDVKVPKPFVPGLSFVAFLIGAYALVSIAIPSNGAWMPFEMISVNNDKVVTGQVYSSDVHWTIFRDMFNKVHIVKTDAIKSRQPCHRGPGFLLRTPAAVLVEQIEDRPDVVCPV